MTQNFNNINALDAFQVPKTVYNAIRNAAAKTGVNFSYLIEKAAAESSFDTNAKAKTSSATGLFQFIDSTWMAMVKDHGDKYGLSKYADKIDDNGRVRDSKTRNEILNLRKDPNISSLMAAEFANSNQDYLQKHVGGQIGSTELYLAHFLGAGGAAGFLNAMKKSPNMAAADIFPKESRTNRTVFYDQKSGAPRSLQEIYAFFDKKFDGGANEHTGTSLLALNNTSNSQNMASTNKYQMRDDTFSRLASLVNQPSPTNSMMNFSSNRLGQAESAADSAQSWQIFPQNLYGNLSLSAAQMMLLNDFAA